METVVRDYFKQLRLGEKQHYRNLTVFPVLTRHAEDLDYILLDEALAAGLLRVLEVSLEGSVPDLRVENKADRMVLILDGEELVGAKQNRIVNTTILVAANATLVVPVSCVEQGRWSSVSSHFSSEERILSAELRAMKARQVHESVRSTAEYRANQGEIWEGISRKADRMRASSPTRAMSHIYEKERGRLEDYLSHFQPVDAQVGAAFAINGKIVGLDSFGKTGTFCRVFRKLLQSYALDALDLHTEEGQAETQESEARRFLEVSAEASMECRASVGLGTDCRLESKGIAGFGLVHEGRLLHLAVFAKNGSEQRHAPEAPMARFSRRRRR